MSTAGFIFWIIIILIIYLGIKIGQYKLFEKAGEDGWKAFVPVYGELIWLKLIGKPTWWLVLLFIPVANILILVTMFTDLVRAFGKHKFGEQFLGTIFPFYYLPKIGFDSETKYLGPALTLYEAKNKFKEEKKGILPANPKAKASKTDTKKALTRQYKEVSKHYNNVVPPDRSNGREWADALLYAGTAALVIRTLMLEAFMVPTTSMEHTILAGDFLFVSKMHYGPRLPMNPASIPFVHNRVRVGSGNGFASYIDGVQLPYFRLPGWTHVKRNDIVVFNFPAHDIYDLNDGAGYVKVSSMKENYIKRCVAVAGDKLEIKGGQIYINDELGENPRGLQHDYIFRVKAGQKFFSCEEMQEMGFRVQDCDQTKGRVSSVRENTNWTLNRGQGWLSATPELAKKIAQHPAIDTLFQMVDPKGEPLGPTGRPHSIKLDESIYPNKKSIKYNRDHFGPMILPKKGMTIDLTDQKNYFTYKQVIERYESQGASKWKDGKASINGQSVTEYTFKQNYYMMMGDNRHKSEDGRFFGFVPEDHIVGTPLCIFFSKEATQNFPGSIRWSRIGTSALK